MTRGGFLFNDMYGLRLKPIKYFKRFLHWWSGLMYRSFRVSFSLEFRRGNLGIYISKTFIGHNMPDGGFLFLRKKKIMKRIMRKLLNYARRGLYRKMSDNAAAIGGYQLFCRR